MNRATVQIIQFLAAVGLGCCLGILYDFYRVWLKKGISRLAMAIGDALFAFVALGGTFVVLLWLNQAEVRFFILLAIALGAFLYLKLLSPFVLPILQKVFRFLGMVIKYICKVVAKVLYVVFKPFVLVSGLLYRLCYLCFCLLRKICLRLKQACGFSVRNMKKGQNKLKLAAAKKLARLKKPKEK